VTLAVTLTVILTEHHDRSPALDAAAQDGLVCARCRRPVRHPTAEPLPPHLRGKVLTTIRRWPEGPICSGCYATACETYGVCDGCGVDRLLPGIGPAGQRWCTDCAGGIGDFTCSRCGQEGWKHYKGVCGRCVLRDRLSTALDDGTGRIRPELQPLFDHVASMARPRSGILWLSKPHVPPLLEAIAHGRVALTHEGIGTLTPWRSAIYVRDLLVAVGSLPPVDRELVLFQQWLPDWLERIPDVAHRKVLNRYATWHVLRQLRTTAEQAPIGHYRHQNARQGLRTAAAFLVNLQAAGHTLETCDQAYLDRWFSLALQHQRQAVRRFLMWAVRTHAAPRLRLPTVIEKAASPISHQQRMHLIRRVHDGTGMDLTERVVGLLILLYAQPLTRIVRLTIDDITTDDGTTDDGTKDSDEALPLDSQHRPPGVALAIRLGDPPAPIPAPFDQLVRDYLAARPNLTTATNRDSRWLFPGRRAGQPLHPTSIRLRLQRLQIPNLDSRSRALREILLQAPPSVVAGMIGYAPSRAEAIAAEAGGTWKRYAPGDHSRQRAYPRPS
jgi:hypothetical protein